MSGLNRTRIDVNAPEIEEAIAQLKEELGYKRSDKVRDIDKKFERKWNCRIVSEDAYGVRGHVYFPDEQHYTYFRLRFGKGETR